MSAELMKAFDFTAEDLAANKNGQLSRRQAERLASKTRKMNKQFIIFTLIFGESEIGDVRRFIYIGGTSIQPAFPALILLIISLASLLARNAPSSPGLQEFIASLIMTGIAAFLVFRQPPACT